MQTPMSAFLPLLPVSRYVTTLKALFFVSVEMATDFTVTGDVKVKCYSALIKVLVCMMPISFD